ncbi:YdaU family protein [Bartonella pachyuromydis]|uniref:Phage related protein n=1 Tax=Bartonella pachyuromydis TaxID=931097 RepID=A0ABP8VJK3_9HYPH
MKHANHQETPHYESSRLPYVCWYQNDFLGGVRGMRAHEIGIYTILLNEMYARGRPLELSVERLARLCGCDKRTFVNVLEMLIEEGKILNLANGLWNKRCEIVFQEREKLLEQKSFAGHCSAKKRRRINAEIEHLRNNCTRDDEQNLEAQNREEKETPYGVLEKKFLLTRPKEEKALNYAPISRKTSLCLKQQDTMENSPPPTERQSQSPTSFNNSTDMREERTTTGTTFPTKQAPNMHHQNSTPPVDEQSPPVEKRATSHLQEKFTPTSTTTGDTFSTPIILDTGSQNLASTACPQSSQSFATNLDIPTSLQKGTTKNSTCSSTIQVSNTDGPNHTPPTERQSHPPTSLDISHFEEDQASSAPPHISSPTGDTSNAGKQAKSRTVLAKGHRLPSDWQADIEAAILEGLSEEQARWQEKKFRDYWQAKSGKDALKVDWQATWRNWFRREIERIKEHQERLAIFSSHNRLSPPNKEKENESLYRSLINYSANEHKHDF